VELAKIGSRLTSRWRINGKTLPRFPRLSSIVELVEKVVNVVIE